MKTFCLTLDPDTRAERARAHFESRRLYNVQFVHGINAAQAGLSTSHPYEVDNPGSGFNVGPKHVGIWLGHYIAWSVMLHQPDSHCLLLEDDVELCPDFREQFDTAMRDVPSDFDLLYLGSCACKGHPSTHVRGAVWDVRYPQCNHAIVYAKKALPLLMRIMRQKCYGPVDCCMVLDVFRPNPDLKIYTVLPRLAEQRDTFLHP